MQSGIKNAIWKVQFGKLEKVFFGIENAIMKVQFGKCNLELKMQLGKLEKVFFGENSIWKISSLESAVSIWLFSEALECDCVWF